MTHDPLCPSYGLCDCGCEYDAHCMCGFIAKVRADERDSAVERILEDVAPYGPEFDRARDGRTTAWLIRDEVINAIRRGTQP